MTNVVVPVVTAVGVNLLNRLLNPGKTVRKEAQRIENLGAPDSQFGYAIGDFFGRCKKSGCSLIWAKELKEVITEERSSTQGGKGGGGATTVTETATYYLTAAYLIGGEIREGDGVRKVFANGVQIFNDQGSDELSTKFRECTEILYGSDAQMPSEVIERYEGAGNVPGFRGWSIIVFDEYPISLFRGSGFPTIDVEVAGIYAGYNDDATFQQIIHRIADKANIDHSNIVFLNGTDTITIRGVEYQNNGQSYRDFIEDLMRVYFLMVREEGGKLYFDRIDRSDAPIQLSTNDLRARIYGSQLPKPYQKTLTDPLELPSKVTVDFINGPKNYERGSVFYQDPSSTHTKEVSYSTACMNYDYDMTRVASRLLYQAKIANQGISKLLLMPCYAGVKEGDYITIAEKEINRVYQVNKKTVGTNYLVELDCTGANGTIGYVQTDTDNYTYTPGQGNIDYVFNITATAYGGATTDYWGGVAATIGPITSVSFIQVDGDTGWKFWNIVINGVNRGIWDGVAWARNKVAFTGFSSYEYGILNPVARTVKASGGREGLVLPVDTLSVASVKKGTTVLVEGVDYTISGTSIIPTVNGLIEDGDVLEITRVVDAGRSTNTILFPDPPVDTTYPEPSVPTIGTATLTPLDLPLIKDTDPDHTVYFAVTEISNWRGGAIYLSRDNGASYSYLAPATSKSITGTVATATASNATTIRVSVNGQLSSVTQAKFDANDGILFSLGDEIIMARDANLVSAGVYDLSVFKRGCRGTEWAIGNHVNDEQFVLLSGYVAKAQLNSSDLGNTLRFKVVGTNGAESEVTAYATLTYVGANLECYSPVNASSTKDQGGNVTINFDRRDRRDGWSSPSPLMSEVSEQYSIDVLNGGSVVRTLNTSSRSVGYTAAQQITDFGAVQSSLTVRIYQLSALVGRGSVLAASLTPTLAGVSPTVTAFSPTFAKADGTITISIYGSGFIGAGSAAINGTPITSFNVASDSLITGIVAVGTTTGKVIVTNSAGSGESLADFTIVSSSVDWGDIGGDINDQTDLIELLDEKVNISSVGANSGVCPLDGSGKIASAYLPSYVDDVLEFANLAAFPVTGESGKIYIALDTNKSYRWSGSIYIEIAGTPEDPLPDQTGNTGKYLSTNGTVASWEDIPQSGHTIENEGTPLSQRTKLNFIGSAVNVTDNSGDDSTEVTINLPETGAGLNLGDWDDSGTFTTGVNFDGNDAKLLIPGITTATRTAATPIEKEVLFDTDLNEIYYGDGTTQGGIKLAKEWVITDVKTANYTAKDHEIVPCDSSGGTFDLTAPSSGVFKVVDVVGNLSSEGFGVTSKSVFVYPTVGKTIHGGTSYELDIGALTYVFTLIGTDWRVSNG